VVTPITRPAESRKRPARVAGIDGRIGLDHVRDLAAVSRSAAGVLRALMMPVVSD